MKSITYITIIFTFINPLNTRAMQRSKEELGERLIAAVTHYSTDFEVLLEQGADPNYRTKRGKTPLLKAISEGFFYKVIDLIKQGADPNQKDAHGRTPVMLAARWGKSRIFMDLIQSGADPNAQDNEGRTVLMYAATQERSRIVIDLIAKGANPNQKDKYGKTALMWAAGVPGDAESVNYLIGANADVFARDNRGETALAKAAKTVSSGSNVIPRRCKLLMDDMLDGATIRQKKSIHAFLTCLLRCYPAHYPHLKNVFKEPLCALIRENLFNTRSEIDKVRNAPLRKNMLKFFCDELGQKLVYAAEKQDVREVEALIRLGADLKQIVYGHSALSWAAAKGCLPIVRLLIESGADPSQRDTDGATPFMRAKRNLHHEVVDYLRQVGADIGSDIEPCNPFFGYWSLC